MSADLPKRAQKLGVDVLTLEDGVPLGPECGLHGPMLPFREWIPKKGRNDDGRSAHLRVKRARLDCNAGEFATCRYYYGCSADRDLSAESGRHKTRVCLKDGLSLLNRSGRGPEPPQWTLGEALPTDLLVHVAAIVDGSKEGVFGWCPVCGRVCGVKVTHGKRKQSHCHCERCHSGKVIKRLDAMKAEKDPLDLYRLVDYNTDEGSMAQYICSDESVGDIVTVIDHLPKPVKRIWCVGTPSIHSAIQKSVRDHKNGSRDLQSILLDLDPIYGVMFPPTFVRINAANGCVWMPAVEDKDAGDGMARLKAMGPPDLVVVDPPFSAPLPAYADGLRKIVRAVEHEHGPVQLLLILPEFLFEKARAGFADDLGIVDYRVTYRNHKKYGKVEQTPVRLMYSPDFLRSSMSSSASLPSTQSPWAIFLPPDRDYAPCNKGDCAGRYYHQRLTRHCSGCRTCQPHHLNHCDICQRCVAPSKQHCRHCGICVPPKHDCETVQRSLAQQGRCHRCGSSDHQRAACPVVRDELKGIIASAFGANQ